MKVFRWILSHLLLLVLVWTAVYIYLDWDNFREQLPVEVTDWIDNLSAPDVTTAEAPQVQDIEKPAVAVAPTQPASEVPQGAPEMAEEATPADEADAPAMAEAAQPDDAASETPAEIEAPVSEPSEPVAEAGAQAEAETQETEAEVTSPSTMEMPHPATGSRPAEPHELAANDKDLLIQAREAFWRRDLAKAEGLYTQLSQEQPGNPDIWGELGNLYFAQNKIKEASDAYYKAAEILIEEGRFRQVENLIGIIGNVDQEKARSLFQRMQDLYQQQPMYMR